MAKYINRPRILIIDDDPPVGVALQDAIKSSFNCEVIFPNTLDLLRKIILSETFDSVLIDANLKRWKPPIKLFGNEVKDGVDFATFYRTLHGNCIIALFGPHNLPQQPLVERRISKLLSPNFKTIDNPLPSGRRELKQTLEALKPTLEETAVFHQENPIFQNVDIYKKWPSEGKRQQNRLLYKSACQSISTWANLNLHEAGDCSWTVLCGGSIQDKYYGEKLNGHQARISDITVRDSYPSGEELNVMAAAKKTAPFVLWNTGEPETLELQFSRADERLKNIPPRFREYFSIATALRCPDAYVSGMDRKVIEWCKDLTPFGQLVATKEIFKQLNGDRRKSVSSFFKRCKSAHLYGIVDIYRARVDEIIEKDQTAIVELTNWAGKENFAAPFDLQILKKHQVEEIDQSFEYTVFVDALNRTGWEISPVEESHL